MQRLFVVSLLTPFTPWHGARNQCSAVRKMEKSLFVASAAVAALCLNTVTDNSGFHDVTLRDALRCVRALCGRGVMLGPHFTFCLANAIGVCCHEIICVVSDKCREFWVKRWNGRILSKLRCNGRIFCFQSCAMLAGDRKGSRSDGCQRSVGHLPAIIKGSFVGQNKAAT